MKHPLLLLALLTGLIFAACTSSTNDPELSGEIQGTTYHIRWVPRPGTANAEQLRGVIEQRFADIDRKLSNYREDSEISVLNRNETTEWITASSEILELIGIARQVSDRTGGCYDLTVKPLFDLWGFSRHENRIPTDSEIGLALQHVGMSRIDIDLPGQRIRKRDAKIRIDLSSIAQGYTVASVAQLLENSGIQDYMVEIGGELRVKGRKSNGQPWRIAIEKPTPFERQVQRILEIHQQNGTAVMTAGTYRNFFEQNGQVYSHILDPRTGRPVTHQLLSVTILHDDPTWADAWDTALLCIGESEAMKIAEREHLKALLIYQEGKELKEFMSPEFVKADEREPGSGTGAAPKGY